MAPVLDAEAIKRVQRVVRSTPVPDHVMRYALRLVRTTRVSEPTDVPRPRMVTDYLSWGAGPRASEYLVLAAKAKAILGGDDHVSPEHVRAVALPVLRHRVLLNFNAEADQVKPDDVVRAMLEEVPVEVEAVGDRRQMDKVLR